MEFLAPLAGGLLNNVFAGFRQSQGQDFAREQAMQAEQFFRLNRQTAYQDTMMDMRAAGLNPILAYQRGATGGTMGATPAVSQAPTPDIGLGASANTALAARRQNQELQNMEAARQLTIAQKETEQKRPANVEQDTDRLRAMTGLNETQALSALSEAMTSKSLADWISANPKMTQALMAAGFVGGKVGEAAQPFINAVRDLMHIPSGSSSQGTTRPNIPSRGHSSKNLSDQDMILPTPNSYKQQQPGWQAAPPKPGGWFTDRWDAMRGN